jgi:iron uptake system component EfeO
MLGIQAKPTVGEVAGYLVYLVPLLLFVLWPTSRRLVRAPASAAVVSICGLLVVLTGCGSKSDADKVGSKRVEVTFTDEGCPASLEVPAGPTTFVVTNGGGGAVSEFEILDGQKVLGEVENVAPGVPGEFSLTLRPGSYVTYCPGGSRTERGKLTVVDAAQ